MIEKERFIVVPFFYFQYFFLFAHIPFVFYFLHFLSHSEQSFCVCEYTRTNTHKIKHIQTQGNLKLYVSRHECCPQNVYKITQVIFNVWAVVLCFLKSASDGVNLMSVLKINSKKVTEKNFSVPKS